MATPNTAEPELRKVYFAEETGDFGAGAGSVNFYELYFNTFGLKLGRAQLQSSRRTGDGQRAIGRLGRYQSAGDITVELTVGQHEAQLEGLLGQKFPTSGGGSLFSQVSGITLSTTAPNILADSGSGFGSVSVDDIILVAGFTDTENNGLMIVLSASAGSLTVAALNGVALTTEAAGDSVTVDQVDMITNSRDVYSYEFEDQHPDIATAEYHHFPGSVIDSGGFTFNNEIVQAVFGILAGGLPARTGTTAASSLVDPTSPHEPCDCLSTAFEIDNVAARLTEASIEATKSRSLSEPLGQKYADQSFQNIFDVIGSFAIYAEDDTPLDEFDAETKKQLMFPVGDTQSWRYDFYIFHAMIIDVDKDEGGGESMMYRSSFEALRHPTILKTMGIRRVTT